jgi:sec-independent protein translocase protein TatB
MLDMSWGEVMVIGAVALIVIGPKDLPKALRTVGQVVGKVRRLASEFQGQFADAMREAELDDVKRQIQGVNDSVSSFNPVQTVRNELKGAVEGATGANAKKPDSAEVPANGHDVHAAPPDPAIALPPVPPIEDPAESIAAAVDPKPVPADAEPMPADRPAEKPIERAS